MHLQLTPWRKKTKHFGLSQLTNLQSLKLEECMIPFLKVLNQEHSKDCISNPKEPLYFASYRGQWVYNFFLAVCIILYSYQHFRLKGFSVLLELETLVCMCADLHSMWVWKRFHSKRGEGHWKVTSDKSYCLCATYCEWILPSNTLLLFLYNFTLALMANTI